jgi:hypothetical protein
MHHIGSSLLSSGLVNTLDPNSPHMTKVTRFIVFLVLHVIFAFDINCIIGQSYGRNARFQFIFLSKPTWFKMFS